MRPLKALERRMLAIETVLAGGLTAAVFLIVLVVGFVYEWKKGALEWD